MAQNKERCLVLFKTVKKIKKIPSSAKKVWRQTMVIMMPMLVMLIMLTRIMLIMLMLVMLMMLIKIMLMMLIRMMLMMLIMSIRMMLTSGERKVTMEARLAISPKRPRLVKSTPETQIQTYNTNSEGNNENKNSEGNNQNNEEEKTRSPGALRVKTSSWRPFTPFKRDAYNII